MKRIKQYIAQIMEKKNDAVTELRQWEEVHPNYYRCDKERARQEIESRLLAELDTMSKDAQAACADFAARVEAKRPRFNPTSKEFLEIGNLISLYGDKMPDNVQEEIARRYKNNPDALNSMLPLFDKNHLALAYTEAKKHLRAMEQNSMSTITDSIYYACKVPEYRGEQSILNMLDEYASQMGVDDTGAPVDTMPTPNE